MPITSRAQARRIVSQQRNKTAAIKEKENKAAAEKAKTNEVEEKKKEKARRDAKLK